SLGSHIKLIWGMENNKQPYNQQQQMSKCYDKDYCTPSKLLKNKKTATICRKSIQYMTSIFYIYITFSHLADAFVQSDVQGREQSSNKNICFFYNFHFQI